MNPLSSRHKIDMNCVLWPATLHFAAAAAIMMVSSVKHHHNGQEAYKF